MNRRLSVIAPLSIASLLCLASCSGSAPAPSPAELAKTESSADVRTASPRLPARWFFQRVMAQDLREPQRVEVSALQQRLGAEMAPNREALRQAVLHVADAVEHGRLDPAQAAEEKAALGAALARVKASLTTAINGVHDALDPAQRVRLVSDLEDARDGQVSRDAEHSRGLSRVAFELGLTREQQGLIADAFNKTLDDVFPDRRARREKWEAKMKALGEGFVRPEFDAAELDLAEHSAEVVASSVEIASRGVDVSNRVLTVGQRRLAADWIRVKAADL